MCLCLIFIILATVPSLSSTVVVGCRTSQRLGRGPNNSSLPRVEVSASVLLPLLSSLLLGSRSRFSSRIYLYFFPAQLYWDAPVKCQCTTSTRRPGSQPPSLRSNDANNGLVEPRPPRGGLVADVVSPPLRRHVGARLRWRTVRNRQQRLRRRQRGRLSLR
jgi:hypothetical protein